MIKTTSFFNNRRKQQIGFVFLGIATLVMVLPIVLLIGYVIFAGIQAMRQRAQK